MASLSTDKRTGCRRILFFGPDGHRRPIYLGKMPKDAAKTVRFHVTAIEAAIRSRSDLRAETCAWLDGVTDDLYQKLVRGGLVGRRATADDQATTIDALKASFEAAKLKAKPSTRIAWGHTWRNLTDRFGADRDIATITEADADTWAEWLHVDQKLSLATIRKRSGNARQFFKFAIKKRLLTANPFAELKAGNVANRDRDHFITRDVATDILAKCPDFEWRLLFALSRFGGLRCPSEHLALRWGDVDWERGRITVRSSKTEHHAGKGSRIVPIFPELRPYLEEAAKATPWADPQSFLINRYRNAGVNLRTQLLKIIKRAGQRFWPKLWHNLRASRQTELEESFPSHVVCAWIGNSQAVARKHYLQVTEDHFTRAQAVAASQAAHQTAQYSAEMGRNRPQQHRQKSRKTLQKQGFSLKQRVAKVGDTGLEPVTFGM
jgi:integrase